MRLLTSLVFLTSTCLISGCILDPTADDFLKVRLPYVTSNQTLVQDEPWNGESLKVHVQHGNVQVVGLREAKTIKVRFHTLTWAVNEDDARAMRDAQLEKFSFRRVGERIEVFCGKMTSDVASASAAATQCNVRVEVPAPEGVVHDVQVYAEDGFTYLNRLASGPTSRIVATGIEIDALLLRGNVELHAGWLDAEVEPIPGATVAVESTTGDWYFIPTLEEVPKRAERDGAAKFGATLRIPKDFSAQRVELFSAGGSVEAFAFPDAVNGYPRGPLDTSSARLVSVRANQGNATLLVFGQTFTSSRTDDFGTDIRDPWSTPVGQ